MKAEILKIAGVKSEKEFYKKYPTEEAFMKAHKKEFKKAAMGSKMVKTQLQQLTDFGNPPIAQVGAYIGGGQQTNPDLINFGDYKDKYDYSVTGMTDEMRRKQAQAAQAQTAQSSQKSGGGIGDMLGSIKALGLSEGGSEGLSSLLGSMARDGKRIPKYQFSGQGIPLGGNPTGGFNWANPGAGGITGNAQPVGGIVNPNSNLNPPALNMGNLASGGVGTTQEQINATNAINDRTKIVDPRQSGLDKFLGKYGGPAGKVIQGIKALDAEKEARKKAEATAKISDLTLQAANTRPEQMKRKYVRPEDAFVQPNQLSPSYGVGTNYLAKDGTVVMQVGGNLGEIQNTYAPNTLYDNLGYEPLNESSQVKQYMHGGFIHSMEGGGATPWDAIGGLGEQFGNAATGSNAGGQIGGAAGGAIGSIFGPAGKAIGQTVGAVAGGLLDKNAKRIEAANKRTSKNVEQAAFSSAAQGLQGQYGGYMEDGGWVSHDWQPQVIASFGEHSMEDLLKRDPQMDTLRTGGHITQNNMFPTDQYALGGELKTTWGGYAEPISHNPYMPGSGETVMFRGKSHEESDGRGHTGIGVKYGEGGKLMDYAEFGSRDADADVEVERGEPATEMIDGQTGEKNMVVFGNLKIPNMFLDQIGDVKAKGKKFKNYVADLGKMEAKQNKIIEKSINKLNENDPHTYYELLEQQGHEANIIGAKMNLKEAALKKSNAAAVQNALNDTAAEHMIDADHLAKGKIKIDKEAMKQQAKYGKEIMKAQTGTEYPFHPITNPTGYKDRLSFSQDVKDIVAPKDQPWYNATPRYQGKLSQPWDPKGNTNKKVYTEAFQKFKEQKQKGQKPFVPYSLNSNVAKIYDLALKDFNEQDSAPVSARKIVKPSDIKTTIPVAETKKTTTTSATTPKTVAKTKGSTSTKSVAPVTTKTAPAPQYSNSTSFLTDKTGRHIKIPIELLQEANAAEQEPTAQTTSSKTSTTDDSSKKGKFNWIPYANQAIEYLRPTDQEAFDYSQVYPEMAALSMNQLEPVQAQLYRPDLGTPMDISLQDQINANQADFNAIQRQIGYNPAATSVLAAQKYAANQQIRGEQFRLNQAEKQRVYEGNRALLNDAQLKNLGILDTQMTRQETAKSKTKEQALEAMKSVADKIAKNKLENRTLGIYENLYKYRFDPSGRAINMNPLAQFDYSGAMASTTPTAPEGYEYETILKKKKKKDEETGRNGKIVRAIKNL